ncbi:MAG: hypothetical protein RIC15_11165 [Vicingaceae bacterium]
MNSLFRHILLIAFTLTAIQTQAQNNVGINTRKPDLTAISHIDDSARGFLLPRTDTQSVWNYVNTLSPNPGIAHGLTIFETNLQTIYIYNGIKQKWEPISSLQGPQGAIGPTGPRGPIGPIGISTQWRDSALLDPVKRKPKTTNIPPYFTQLGDTCGDIYHQTATGLVWSYNCDSNRWDGPIARWRNLGPGELSYVKTLGLYELNMSPGSAQDTLGLIPGLTYTFRVPPDTIAHVWITSQGNVSKSKRNDTSFNKMAFDFYVIDTNGVGQYHNSRKTVSIGPNFLITTSNFSQFDKVPWSIHMAKSFEGKISPAGNPLPKNDFNTFTIETHAGQFYRPDNPLGINGRVTISDGGASANAKYENYAIMNVYIIFERSKNAPYPY